MRSSRVGSPFAATIPAIVAAGLWSVVGIGSMVLDLPAEAPRWFPLHVFTLGVVTNLILAFSRHFCLALTRVPEPEAGDRLWVTNTAVAAVLVGLPRGNDLLVIAGAVGLSVVVGASWWQLRAMRRKALGARFGWVVRCYERAHGAFLHGALLGALLGSQVLTGAWYSSGRLAHLHVNLLGWAGMTVLATLVFFGPSVARARMLSGADDRAARWLRAMATLLTIAVLLLLLSGVGSTMGSAARILAGLALVGFAAGVASVCLPVARAAMSGRGTAGRWPVVAVCTWFPVVAAADAGVVLTGRWRLLDAVGAAFLVGVLVQVILAALLHVAPMARRPAGARRTRVHDRLAVGAVLRTTAFNLGALLLVAAAAQPSRPEGVLMAAGAALTAIGLLGAVVVARG